MKRVATGLLVAMALVYALARSMEPRAPAWGYLRAFAEAAMVGGLADWFAVTALFRHPVGVPIPHTAIIPRNKDRIGDSLAVFLRANFLTPSVVARRMRRIDLAAAAGRYLAAPKGSGDGRLREGAGAMIARVLESLNRERLGGLVRHAVAGRLRSLELSPLLGQALAAAMAEDRHRPVIDGLVRWAAHALEDNEALVRQMIQERAGSLLRWTGLDTTVADKIVAGLSRLLGEMAENPAHPIRQRAENSLAALAQELQHDPETRARVERWKALLVDNPAVVRWIDGLWEQGRAALLRIARDPGQAGGGRLGEVMRGLGASLQEDARLRAGLNAFARRATVGAVSRYGDGLVRLVSDTIRGWDSRTITGRIESAVGRDLQYIRINGTVVGGLVGLAIHLIDTLR